MSSKRRERVDYNMLSRSDEQNDPMDVDYRDSMYMSDILIGGVSSPVVAVVPRRVPVAVAPVAVVPRRVPVAVAPVVAAPGGAHVPRRAPVVAPVVAPVAVPQIHDISEWLRSNGCDISQYIIDIKVLSNVQKSSASDSIILFGNMTLNNILSPVAFKIVFPSRYPFFFNSLVVEQQIYTSVTQNMIDNNRSPHLTSCIGIANSCNIQEFENKLSHDQRRTFIENKNQIDKRLYDVTKANILILSKSGGKTVRNYFKDQPVVDVHFKFNMLFQILYTLRCFEKVGLSHNDLHLNNIFVDEITPLPQERIYYIGDNEWVKTSIKYDIKIFDFDRGAILHPSVDRNFTIDELFCDSYDECNKYSSRRDLSAILLGFYSLSNDGDPMRTFIESLTTGGKNGPFLTRGLKRRFLQLNAFTENGGNRLHRDPEIDGTQLLSIAECIEQLLSLRYPISGKTLFEFSRGNGGSNGLIYTLPRPIRPTMWNPSTSLLRRSKRFRPPVQNIEITQQYIDGVLEPYLRLSIKDGNIYEQEFGKDHFKVNTIKLFKEYIHLKPIAEDFYGHVIVACYLLCIPFLYKFDSNDLIQFLTRSFLRGPGESLILQEGLHTGNNLMPFCQFYAVVVDDIWNMFYNTLPISMIKM